MSAIPEKDITIVRRLATEVADIAAMPCQDETRQKWQLMNGLKPARPMAYIYQIPWREMDVNNELALQTENRLCHGVEGRLREILYRWRHLPADMVVDSDYEVGYAVHSTGVGMATALDSIPHDTNGGVSAKYYHSQIEDENDIEKITMPVITCDWDATESNYQAVTEILDGILRVEKCGKSRHNYAPWDRLAEWWNPQQVLMDLILRPQLVHAAMDRLTSAYMSELDQLVEQGLLSVTSGNYVVGQGGMGFTDELPQPDFDADNVRLIDHWGGAMAQIFSEVSPDMHEEFALQYESRYLKRFGLCYYGCCEPLDRKVAISMKHIPNLRKISMSPWVNPERGAEAIGDRLVFSFKPNPAFLATDNTWDRASAQREIEEMLDAAHECAVEIILKDISTVRFEPQRLWEWADMVMEIVRRYE